MSKNYRRPLGIEMDFVFTGEVTEGDISSVLERTELVNLKLMQEVLAIGSALSHDEKSEKVKALIAGDMVVELDPNLGFDEDGASTIAQLMVNLFSMSEKNYNTVTHVVQRLVYQKTKK